MLRVKDITKYYGTERILNKISFSIERGHKVALVGFNGTGKSTLLKILSGNIAADSGKLEFHPGTVVGFLPQDSDAYNRQGVVQYITNYVNATDDVTLRNIDIMFAGFALPPETKEKKIGDLSSGQKTKVFLTAVLLKRADLLLLDEPTNNLDLPALIWLEDFLQKTDTPFIVVSHDKTFLDTVANKIYEIDWLDRNLHMANGRYSDYVIRKQKEYARQLHQHELQVEEKQRLRAVAQEKQERAAKGAKYKGPDNDRMLRGYRRDKAKNSYRESKLLFTRIKRMEEIKKPNARKEFKIDILPTSQSASCDIVAQDLYCGYDDGFRIGPITLDIRMGSRMCILGLNGSGKSTLLKTITGRIPPKGGMMTIGDGVLFGNLMQEHESLPKNETLIGFLSKRVETERAILQNHLLHFGFSEWQVKTRIKELSPGGRARLLLALFAAQHVNTLVLDEPTNHLDAEASEALEKALGKFEGTVITVTHDRSFVQKTNVGDLYVLDGGVLHPVSDFVGYVGEMQKRARKLLRMLK